MLDRAERMHLTEDSTIPVVHTEDLVGLKVQASVNDPEPATRGWNDIYMLIDESARSGTDLDWELINDYLKLFGLGGKLAELEKRYAEIASS